MNDTFSRTSALMALISFLWTISPAAYALETASQPDPSLPELNISVQEEKELFSYELTPDKDHTIVYENVSLEIPAGAVSETVTLTIEKLDRVKTLNEGMKNVTTGAGGYRFGPHPITFKKNIKVSLPYSKSISGSESALSNLNTWFYNENDRHWESLPVHSIDKENCRLTSLTNHFTDMITSTLTLPESPSPINFDPNSIKELKAADPGSTVPEIKGPEPGPMGGSSFNIPLRLPPGRGRAVPELSLSYNVNSSNSWLGKGFDLSIPSITTDTKFGLPKYNGADTYMLQGEELILEADLGSGYSQYVPKNEQAFSRIIRYRSGSQDYWTVTEKDGTAHTYGTSSAWAGKSSTQVFTWYLKETKDRNGNTVTYSYKKDQGYTYPQYIDWSGHEKKSSTPYRVEFITTSRTDKRIDNRGKFSSKLALKLSEVQISYNGDVFRTYVARYESEDPDYIPNIFGQSQLVYWIEEDGDDSELQRFGFEYETLPENASGGYDGFGESIYEWSTLGSERPLDENLSKSMGADLGVGVAVRGIKFKRWGLKLFDWFSFGVNGGFSSTNSWAKATMVDMDGNGLPDLVRQSGSSLKSISNTGDGFSTEKSYPGFSAVLNQERQTSFSIGTTASAGVASAGLKKQWSNSHGKSTLTDLDGDGYIDLVKEGTTDYATYEGGSAFESKTWAAQDAGPVETITQEELDSYDNSYYIEEPVKKWLAYKPGNITVDHSISLVDASRSSEKGVGALIHYPDGDVKTKMITSESPIYLDKNITVSEEDPIYLTLDTLNDIRDTGNEEDILFTDDLKWNTRIRYESINFFNGYQDTQPIWIFPEPLNYYTYLDEFDGLYDDRTDYDVNPPAVVYYVKENASDIFNTLPYEQQKAIATILIEDASFIPRQLTFSEYDRIYTSSTTSLFAKSVLQVMYPYDSKKDLFILQDLQSDNYDETIGYLQGVFNTLEDDFTVDELYDMALPSLNGNTLYWAGDMGGSPGIRFTKSVSQSDSYLREDKTNVASDSEVGRSYGVNSILLDKIHDNTEGLSYDFYLIQNSAGSYTVKEKTSDGSECEYSVSYDNGKVTFPRGVVDHRYDLSFHNYPLTVDASVYDNEVYEEIRQGETHILFPLKSLPEDYYHQIVDPLYTDYMAKKTTLDGYQSGYDGKQEEIDGKKDLILEKQGIIDGSDDTEEIAELQDQIATLNGEIAILETERDAYLPLIADAQAELIEPKALYMRYAENYNLSDGRYELEDTVSASDYLVFQEDTADSFTKNDLSLFSHFSESGSLEDCPNILTNLEKDALSNYSEYFKESSFSEYTADDGSIYYMLTLHWNDELAANQIQALNNYRVHVEKFPYYTKSSTVYTFKSEYEDDDTAESAIKNIFSSLLVKVPESVTSYYSYEESTFFPQEEVTLESSVTVQPVSFMDGSGITAASGDKVSRFDFINVSGIRTDINKIYTHIFDTAADYIAEDAAGDYLLIDFDTYYDDAYYNQNPSYDPPSGLIEYFHIDPDTGEGEITEIGEIFGGGCRNWYYGFWTAKHDWDPNLIGSEEYSDKQYDTAPEAGSEVEMDDPPYLSTATVNLNVESGDVSIEKEGTEYTTLPEELWIGTTSDYQDSYLEVEGDEVVTKFIEYDFAPYMAGDDTWHPMRIGGIIYYNTPAITTGTATAGGGSMGDIRKSKTSGYNVTYSAGPINYSNTKTNSWNYRGFQDLNGDRYPDRLTDNNSGTIKSVLGTGTGFSGDLNLSGAYKYLNYYKNETDSFGISFGVPGGNDDTQMSASGKAALSIVKGDFKGEFPSGNVNGSRTSSKQTIGLMDMNGDGLPDHISRSSSGDYSVVMNQGDTFQSEQNWTNGMNSALSRSYTGSLGTSLSIPISDYVGIGGGVSGTANKTEFQLLDINGDGLLDQVEKKTGENYFKVRFNLGDSYGSTQTIHCPSWGLSDQDFQDGMQDALDEYTTLSLGGMAELSLGAGFVNISDLLDENEYTSEINPFIINDTITSSTGVSFNLGGTVTIRIPFWLLTFNIQPGVNGSAATTSTSVKMTDMNGDGAPDHILKMPGTDALYLRVNQMDKVGMLKTVNLPQGGSYDFAYERTRNTVLDPNSRWYLSSLTKNDGYEESGAEGAHSYETTFSIGSGQYNRTERDFYGFDSVTTTFADGTYQVNSYYNDEYYRKGKLYLTELYSSNDKLLSRTVNDYSRIYPYSSASSFYRLESETTRTYTTEGSNYTELVKEYDYDSFGNITELASSITGADEDQNYLLQIGYAALNNYIISMPNSLKAYKGASDKSSNLLRMRTAVYDDDTGNLKTLSQYSGFKDITTTLTYDDYGNIKSVTDPMGYTISYNYDGTWDQYVTEIISSDGSTSYTSEMTWNMYFGLEESSTEINDNTQIKEYDSFGRLIRIQSPYDSSTGTGAVEYSYFTDEFPWRAVSSNKVSFDQDNDETMETVITIDGLGRITQTAKEGEITLTDGSKQHGWNRSGAVIYDYKARTIKEGQTQFEELDYGLPVTLDDMPSATPLTRETETEYDELDRPVKVSLPDGSVIRSHYPIEKVSLSGASLQSCKGENHQGVIQIDPEGKVTEVWKNGRGMISAIVKKEGFNGDPGDSVNWDSLGAVATEVSYSYNLLGELLTSQDYMGNQVDFTYDLLGRQLTIESPDTGRQEFTYNDAGLVTKKTDSQLRSEGLWIEYKYDGHNRLTEIVYPEQDPVKYTYGTDTSKNNKGRLSSVSNESGTTSYEYGSLGEITSMTRSIARLTPNTDDISATMGYQSDYLGRMESITYPDKEVLTYSYDQGGQINGAIGTRHDLTSVSEEDRTFVYIEDIGYDEYGQRVYIKYGNGTETNYTYDEDRRWLSNIKTSLTTSGNLYQNMNYSFDNAGNILSTVNETLNHDTTQTYTYDDLYQITSAVGSYDYHNGGGVVTRDSSYTQSFSYDKIGNMLTKVSSEDTSSSGLSSLDYDNSYSYYADAPHRVEVIGNMYYRYDLNGNLEEERIGGHRSLQDYDQAEYNFRDNVTVANQAFAWDRDSSDDDDVYSRQFEWDEENRLKATVDPNHWTVYRYDQDGERTLKYSDLGETLYFDSMWSVCDTESTDGLRQSKNIYVGETRIATKLNFADSDLGYEKLNTYYYHTDHLSSSNVVTDPDGEVYEHLEYTPYGEMWVEDQQQEDLDKIPYRFTSKEWDEETELYYMSARYQDPMTSRWISADPKGHELLNPDRDGFSVIEGTNWYTYCSNNPVKYNDPTGEAGNFIVGALIGAGTSAAAQYMLDTATALAQGKGKDSFTPQWDSIAKSAAGGFVAGAVTSGVSSIKTIDTLVKTTKVVRAAVTSAGAMSGAAVTTGLDNLSEGKAVTENMGRNVLTAGVVGGALSTTLPTGMKSSQVQNVMLGTEESLDSFLNVVTPGTAAFSDVLSSTGTGLLQNLGSNIGDANADAVSGAAPFIDPEQ